MADVARTMSPMHRLWHTWRSIKVYQGIGRVYVSNVYLRKQASSRMHGSKRPRSHKPPPIVELDLERQRSSRVECWSNNSETFTTPALFLASKESRSNPSVGEAETYANAERLDGE